MDHRAIEILRKGTPHNKELENFLCQFQTVLKITT